MTCIVPSYLSATTTCISSTAPAAAMRSPRRHLKEKRARRDATGLARLMRGRRAASPSASPRSSASGSAASSSPIATPTRCRAATARGASMRRLSRSSAAPSRDFAALLAAMDSTCRGARRHRRRAAAGPRWDQDWFPRLDAAAAYVLVRETKPAPHRRGRLRPFHALHGARRPRRRPRDRDHRDRPGAARRHRRDRRHDPAQTGAGGRAGAVHGARSRRHAVHRFQPHPDAGHRCGFPLQPRRCRRCRPACCVHVHDIFLPDDYPAEWEWRGYNEQLGVAALIQGGGYRMLWSSHYAATRMAAAVAASAAGSLRAEGRRA